MMFIELKCRSNFSFLEGASDAREYVYRAIELGMKAVGISDRNGVYGIPRAFEAAKEIPDFKLITGAELTISGRPSLHLIARDRGGYAVLCRLLSASHAGKEKGKASLSEEELVSHLADPRGSGLFAIPSLAENTNFELLKDLFQDRLYFPITKHLDGFDQKRIESVLTLCKRYGVKPLATNDVHYHVEARRNLQDCLTCIREGVPLREAGFKLFGNAERYLKSPLQMMSLFRDLPISLKSTLEVAEACTFSLSQLRYVYPRDFIPEGETDQSYFERLVYEGAHRIYRGLIPSSVDAQIQHEFKLIRKMNYASYFLTIWDIVDFARKQNIICQGRGSAANSICCYLLGITAIDPVRMNLLFERFISEERSEPPDIDVDFEHERREEVIQYIYRRYGRDFAGMVSAVRTYRSRSAFLELSKSIGVDVGSISAGELDRDFERRAGSDADKRPVIDGLIEELKEFPRHLSIHSGGFTLSSEPIIETVPIEPARMEGRTIIQWDKNDLDTTGLLKLDILSLGFLTALHKICDLVGINWRDIPGEDPATYEMICRAETEGTFQIESRAQKAMLPRTQPRTLYDLVVQVAIVRPGPNVGEMIHPYTKRREAERRGEKYVIEDPELRAIVGRTYGVPIFQEQIMKLAIVKAKFTPGQADQLRRSLASFRASENVEVPGKILYEGLLKNGVSQAYADELFTYIKGFAHYGFPESHAASFALISYKSAYLKCHYPAEFLCGLINSQPMGFYSVDTLISDGKRRGVKVLPLNPHVSVWDACMEGKGTIRMGFRNVRGINRDHVEEMIRKRAEKPFTSLQDFLYRTSFPKDVVSRLALSDFFQCFGVDQRHTFWESIEFSNLVDRESSAQLNLFGAVEKGASAPVFDRMSLLEEITSDYQAVGYSLRGNVMRGIRSEFHAHLPKYTSHDFRAAANGKQISVSGVIMVMQRPPTAKGVCFITLEDEFGTMDLILHKNVFEEFEDVIRTHRILVVQGRVQKVERSLAIIVRRVVGLDCGVGRRPTSPGEHPRSLGPILSN